MYIIKDFKSLKHYYQSEFYRARSILIKENDTLTLYLTNYNDYFHYIGCSLPKLIQIVEVVVCNGRVIKNRYGKRDYEVRSIILI